MTASRLPLDGVVPFPPEFAARYRERGYWRDQTLDQVFSEIFEQFADRIALRSGPEKVRYRDLATRAALYARNARRLGIGPLDRVVFHLPNIPEFVYLYFGLQKVGAIPILALAAHRRLELVHFARLAEARALVTTNDEVAAEVRAELPKLPILKPDDFERPSTEPLPDAVVAATDPCCFLLSGGTTGIPKLIPRTHNDYLYNSRAASAVQDIEADSVQLCVAPLAHNMPLACPGLQGFLMAGAAVTLAPSPKAQDVLPAIAEHKITHIAAVPALYIRWLDDPEIGNHDLRSVRLLQSGGQRLQPELRRRMAAAFPNAFVQENFGMSEGTLFFVRKTDPPEAQMETVGRPVSEDDEVRLIDEDGHDVADGEVGELAVRGPYTLRGYYRAPEHNARVFTADGFYMSGDLMRKHPSGSYLVEGRIKDLVNRGGEKISAEEVENLILTHPAVRNVACIPVPDPVLGERMCACVILRNGSRLTLEQLTSYLLDQGIAKFKLPERIKILEDFPLSAFGKVSKKTLVERLKR